MSEEKITRPIHAPCLHSGIFKNEGYTYAEITHFEKRVPPSCSYFFMINYLLIIIHSQYNPYILIPRIILTLCNQTTLVIRDKYTGVCSSLWQTPCMHWHLYMHVPKHNKLNHSIVKLNVVVSHCFNCIFSSRFGFFLSFYGYW